MMTDHVHDWHFAYTHYCSSLSNTIAIAKCKECGLERGPTWIEAMLNEHGKLEAELGECHTNLSLALSMYEGEDSPMARLEAENERLREHIPDHILKEWAHYDALKEGE